MLVVPIEQSGPLFWTDPQSRLHCHANDLPIMFTTKRLVGAKLGKKSRQGGREGGIIILIMCLVSSSQTIIKREEEGEKEGRLFAHIKCGSFLSQNYPFLREFVPCLLLHLEAKRGRSPPAQEAQTSV